MVVDMSDRDRTAEEVFGSAWAQDGGPPATGAGAPESPGSGFLSVVTNPETGQVQWIPRDRLPIFRAQGWVEVTGRARLIEHAEKIAKITKRIPHEPGERVVVNEILQLGEFGGEPRFKVDYRLVGAGDNTRTTGSSIVDSKGDPADPTDVFGDGGETPTGTDALSYEQTFPTYEIPRGSEEIEVVRIQSNNNRAMAWRSTARALAEKTGVSSAEAIRWTKEVQARGGEPGEAARSVAEAARTLANSGRPGLAEAFLDAEAPHTVLANDVTTATRVTGNVPTEPYLIDPGFGSSGGGGGTRTVRKYIPPDRREVRDSIRGLMAALVGKAEKSLLEEYTDIYMAEDRAAFDKQDGRSPKATVLERIRKQGDYQRIHKLRPDTVAEEDWVTNAMGVAIGAGMTATRGSEFGVRMATVGATDQDIQQGVLTQEFQRTGQARPEFFDRFQETARALFQGVR